MTPEQQSPTQMDKLDFISSIVLTLFGIGVLVESLRLPRLEHLDINSFTIPGIVPGFLGALITICGFFVLGRSIVRGGWRLGVTRKATAIWARSSAVKRSAVTFFLTITYALILFPNVPFIIATPLFIFAFVVSAETMEQGGLPRVRAVVTALILAVIAGLVIGYVFQELFYVRLPGG